MAIAPAFVPPPTATHTLELAQLMALRGTVVFDICGIHVAPPLLVVRTVPNAPTAKHVV
jgi:hypothetical protein